MRAAASSVARRVASRARRGRAARGLSGAATSARGGASSASAVSEESQGRLLEHYAAGLRGILAEADDLADPALVSRLRALRDDAPVRLEHPFWGAPFLAIAFGHELGFAAAHPPALRAVFNLAVAAAERGLVPYHAVRSAHAQLRSLGLLTCDRVDPPPPPPRPATADDAPPASAAPPRLASPWELFASARLRDAAATLAEGLSARGYAVVDDALGPRLAATARSAAKAHRGLFPDRFIPGELDATGRSDPAARGDVVAWLAGDEGTAREERARASGGGGGGGGDDDDDDDDARAMRRSATGSSSESSASASASVLLPDPPPAASAGALAQLMRSGLSQYLVERLPRADELAPPETYASNAMLSAYAPGAPGFAPHRDHCGPSDPRRVTAVYYPNGDGWGDDGSGWGGELVLFPSGRGGERRALAPRGDRLVAFWSDEVEHEVLPVREDAGEERLALSFWFLRGRPSSASR